MPKLTRHLGGFFTINGSEYPEGKYMVVSDGDLVAIEELETRDTVIASAVYANWTNSLNQPYATKDDLLIDLKNTIFL
jgi:hypothetical protein